MSENNELMQALNLRILGTRDNVEYIAQDIQIFDNEGKFNRKSISSAGLILGRVEDAIQINVLEREINDAGDNVNTHKGSARINNKDTSQWNVYKGFSADSSSYPRTGTKKSGQKDIVDALKKCDMRFDFTHVVQLMLKAFYPGLKVSGSGSDGIRSKYQIALIESMTMLLDAGISEEKIKDKLFGDDITNAVWDKMMTIAKAEVKELAVESEDDN